MHGLVLDLAGLDDAPLALDAEGDLAMRQGGAVAVLGEVEHPAATFLDSSVSLVRSAMLGGAYLGKLPIEPGEFGEQVGAIVLGPRSSRSARRSARPRTGRSGGRCATRRGSRRARRGRAR